MVGLAQQRLTQCDKPVNFPALCESVHSGSTTEPRGHRVKRPEGTIASFPGWRLDVSDGLVVVFKLLAPEDRFVFTASQGLQLADLVHNAGIGLAAALVAAVKASRIAGMHKRDFNDSAETYDGIKRARPKTATRAPHVKVGRGRPNGDR